MKKKFLRPTRETIKNTYKSIKKIKNNPIKKWARDINGGKKSK